MFLYLFVSACLAVDVFTYYKKVSIIEVNQMCVRVCPVHV